MTAPLPHDELERLMALARYQILDTLPEEAFDRVTSLTADLLGTDLAVINFVDQHRQWGKSCVGVASTEEAREHSFCAWTILGDDVMVVPDTLSDPRFAHNPMVTGELQVRTYAGAPLITATGHRVGTLCVTTRTPRAFDPLARSVLQRFAAIVVDELELRLRTLELEREASAREYTITDLKRTLGHARTLAAITDLLDCELDAASATLVVSELLGQATLVDWAGLLVGHGRTFTAHTAWHAPHLDQTLLTDVGRVAAHTQDVAREVTRQGRPLFIDRYPEHPGAAPEVVRAGVWAVAGVPLGEVDGVTYVLLAVRLDHTTSWRTSDRSLFEASARTVRAALARQVRLDDARRAADHDDLTGLLNRRAFEGALLNADPAAETRSLIVVVIDVDGLKHVNDTYGHDSGDRLLREFARALSAHAPDDTVFRVGGDEFALLRGHDGHGGDDVRADLLERVDLAVVQVRSLDPAFAHFGASAGAAHAGSAAGARDAYTAAEAAMSAMKRRKGQRVLSASGSGPATSTPPERPGEDEFRLDLRTRTLHVRTATVQLSPTEFTVLRALMHTAGDLVSRETLETMLPRRTEGSGSKVLDVHVANLRRKLARVAPNATIRVTRGAGYALQFGVPDVTS